MGVYRQLFDQGRSLKPRDSPTWLRGTSRIADSRSPLRACGYVRNPGGRPKEICGSIAPNKVSDAEHGHTPVRRTVACEVVSHIPPRLLDLKSAAAYLRVSPWTIRDLEASGTLRRVNVPLGMGKDLRKLLFDREDLDPLVDSWKL